MLPTSKNAGNKPNSNPISTVTSVTDVTAENKCSNLGPDFSAEKCTIDEKHGNTGNTGNTVDSNGTSIVTSSEKPLVTVVTRPEIEHVDASRDIPDNSQKISGPEDSLELGIEELSASARRLEAAGVCIAIWDGGRMRVVVTEVETVQAINDGGTIYSPQDMLMFVALTERERRMLHKLKKCFGGTTEWEAGTR
jgi:hypothetical protein